MKSTNSFAISGRLTSDATISKTGAVARFRIAHNFGKDMEPLFVDCVMFSKNGKKDVEIPTDLLKKGNAVLVSGYQRPNVYVNPEGKKYVRTDYVVLTCTTPDAEDTGAEAVDITVEED